MSQRTTFHADTPLQALVVEQAHPGGARRIDSLTFFHFSS